MALLYCSKKSETISDEDTDRTPGKINIHIEHTVINAGFTIIIRDLTKVIGTLAGTLTAGEFNGEVQDGNDFGW